MAAQVTVKVAPVPAPLVEAWAAGLAGVAV